MAKIRCYGILSNRNRQERLEWLRTLIAAENTEVQVVGLVLSPPPPDIRQCPECGKLDMICIDLIPGGFTRAPPRPVLIQKTASILN